MTGKNKGKTAQMLSPENYIRQRARSLPIYECLINEDWKESGIANISVARSHTNGNITLCFYLVDLLCLGIKDSHYMFNISLLDYRKHVEMMKENMKMEKIDYVLAHNIIYAGLEFAHDFGFFPHKDFTMVTRFMLEDDDPEKIEFIDIECGDNGRPRLMQGPFDDERKIKSMIATLEKTAGPGNYDFFSEADLDDADFDETDDDADEDELEEETEEEDEFMGMSVQEKVKLFQELNESIQKNRRDESATVSFGMLLQRLFDDLCDSEKIDAFYDNLGNEINSIKMLDGSDIPDEFLGIGPDTVCDRQMLKQSFLECLKVSDENPGKVDRILRNTLKKNREIPGFYYLELSTLRFGKRSAYLKKLDEYAVKFPDFTPVKVLYQIEKLSDPEIKGFPNSESICLKTLFKGRQSLHPGEMVLFLHYKALVLAVEGDLNKIEAFNHFMYEFTGLPERYSRMIKVICMMMKITAMLRHIEENYSV